jgi:hypothetical protein
LHGVIHGTDRRLTAELAYEEEWESLRIMLFKLPRKRFAEKVPGTVALPV